MDIVDEREQIPAFVHCEYVGFWPRVGAVVIDVLLLGSMLLCIDWAIYGDVAFSGQTRLGLADDVISIFFPAVWTIAFWIIGQATPGQWLIRTRVVDAKTGQPASDNQYILRYLGFILSLLTLGLGFLWVAFNPHRQGLHDLIAGTIVIRR